VSFLEWIITWFCADQLASRQEEAKELQRLKREVVELRSEIQGFRKSSDDGKEPK